MYYIVNVEMKLDRELLYLFIIDKSWQAEQEEEVYPDGQIHLCKTCYNKIIWGSTHTKLQPWYHKECISFPYQDLNHIARKIIKTYHFDDMIEICWRRDKKIRSKITRQYPDWRVTRIEPAFNSQTDHVHPGRTREILRDGVLTKLLRLLQGKVVNVWS